MFHRISGLPLCAHGILPLPKRRLTLWTCPSRRYSNRTAEPEALLSLWTPRRIARSGLRWRFLRSMSAWTGFKTMVNPFFVEATSVAAVVTDPFEVIVEGVDREL